MALQIALIVSENVACIFYVKINIFVEFPISASTSEPLDVRSSSSTDLPPSNVTTIKTPLNENKTSPQKAKLLNQSLNNNNKAGNLDHLLGVNGTGQRKDNLTVPTIDVTTKVTPININTALGKDREDNPFDFEDIDISDTQVNK
jgi:hypothetical protein